ncbi:MAG: hypothetical protein EOO15_19975 [Chitinophagaceae bacterium]|nr:MAG: hypothetical protein EOO15_19975 [Chitinophagaceae bacterium]
MQQASFNPAGSPLWVTVDMRGMYYMTYTYRLWGVQSDPHAVLTNPVKANNNKVAIDDYYKIENNYVQNEPLASHDGRVVNVDLDVIKVQDDPGYNVTVAIWQADSDEIIEIMQSIALGNVPALQPLATDTESGKLDGSSSTPLRFWFELVKE